MAKEELRHHHAQPRRIPPRVKRILLEASDAQTLKVKVTAKSGIRMSGFAYAGAPVPMSSGEGTFSATPGRKGLLEWSMVGDPGGSMKVTVTAGAKTVAERARSEILPPFSKGYDALEILV